MQPVTSMEITMRNVLSFMTTILCAYCLFAGSDIIPVVADEDLKDDKANEAIRREYESKAQLRIKNFSRPKDLAIDLWADESQTKNPSAITFDSKGRMYVCEINRWRKGVDDIRHRPYMMFEDILIQSSADRLKMFENHVDKFPMDWYTAESDQIRLLEDVSGNGRADKSTVFAGGFNDPLDGPGIGVIERDGKVYYTNIPHLWMLEDTDKDGVSDRRTSLQEGFGIRMSFSGHDMHGLIWGPDGKLYWSIGDRGFSIVTKEGKKFHGPNTGAVFRCDPDGSNIELFYEQLRNPQELAFDDYGNLFTADNDADAGDIERLNYLVEGGNSGWHAGNQAILSFANNYNFRTIKYVNEGRMFTPWMTEDMWTVRKDHHPAYILPGIGVINGGPSGLVFNPSNSMGKVYDDCFFVIHYKGAPIKTNITSFKVEEEGASYKMIENKPFLKGSNCVDLEFGPDGKMYLSDYNYGGWVNQDVGNIYTLYIPEAIKQPEVESNRQILTSEFSKFSIEKLFQLLSRDHQQIRLKAQFELAKRGKKGSDTFYKAATNTQHSTFTRIHGIWGLGQMASKNISLLKPLFDLIKDDNDQVRIQSARVLGDHKIKKATSVLIEALKDKHSRVAMYAGIGLGRIGCEEEAYVALVDVLRKNNGKDLWLQHGAVMGLLGVNDKKLYVPEMKDSSRAVRMGMLLVLRRLKDPRIAQFLKDDDQKIVYEAIRAINDLAITGAQTHLAAYLDNYLPGKNAQMPKDKIAEFMHHRLINANYYEATEQNALRLIKYITNKDVPEKQRREAVAALQAWDDNHSLDNTTGLPRALTSDREDIKPVVLGNIKTMLASSQGKLLTQCSALARQYGYTFSSLELLSHLKNFKMDVSMRVESLKVLADRKDKGVLSLLPQLMKDKEQTIAFEALKTMLAFDKNKGTQEAMALIKSGSLAQRQFAIRLIAKSSLPEVRTWFKQELIQITQGKGQAGTMLEVLEACRANNDPEFKEILSAYDISVAQKPLLKYASCLEGGDKIKGEDIFFNLGSVQCFRCHKVNKKGADVGPDLSAIGKHYDRKYILQSIVDPGAVVSPGFGMVSMTLKDGTAVAGILVKETDDDVSIKVVDKIKKYSRKDIDKIQPPISGMPPVNFLLTPQQIRDLVAYLATLKKEPKTAKSH